MWDRPSPISKLPLPHASWQQGLCELVLPRRLHCRIHLYDALRRHVLLVAPRRLCHALPLAHRAHPHVVVDQRFALVFMHATYLCSLTAIADTLQHFTVASHART